MSMTDPARVRSGSGRTRLGQSADFCTIKRKIKFHLSGNDGVVDCTFYCTSFAFTYKCLLDDDKYEVI